MSSFVTHWQIARRAGVSKATVSLALRGQPNVSRAVAARIRRLAKKMGYRPNPLLAAHMAYLRSGRAPTYRATIAYLDQRIERPSDEEREMHARWLAGCARRAEELGYKLEKFEVLSPELSDERLSRILISRGIHGVVVGPLATWNAALALDWDEFAAVALGYSLRSPQLHRICSHHFQTMQEILQRLTGLGYRRIGLAMSQFSDNRVNHLWLGGYLAHSRFLPEMEAIRPLITEHWGRKEFIAWYRTFRPDAVVSNTIDVLGWLRSAGLRVPGLVGFVKTNLARTAPERQCSGYDQNFEKLGEAAIDFVVGQMNLNRRGIPAKPSVLEVEGEWVAGETLRDRGR